MLLHHLARRLPRDFVWRRAAALISCKGLTAAATQASIGTEPIISANPKYISGYHLNLVRSFNNSKN